jgi:hypothetical protein
MDEAEFLAAVGSPPGRDDLARANCRMAGRIGHAGCGVCWHGKPVFACPPCFAAETFHQLRNYRPSMGGTLKCSAHGVRFYQADSIKCHICAEQILSGRRETPAPYERVDEAAD